MTTLTTRQRQRHAILTVRNPWFTFLLGLIMGVLLNRQILMDDGAMTAIAMNSVDYNSHIILTDNNHARIRNNETSVASRRDAASCPVCSPCEPSAPAMSAESDQKHTTTPLIHTLQQQSTAESSSPRQSTRQLQQSLLFPQDSIRDLVVGMSRIDRDDFANQVNLGYALDPTTAATQHVLVLYGSEKSLPNSYNVVHEQLYINTSSSALSPVLSVDDALENCQTIKLVLTQPSKKIYRRKKKLRHDAECLAIMSQWESQHVHKFQRVNKPRMIDNNGTTTETPVDNKTKSWKYVAARPDLEVIAPEHVHANRQALLMYLQAMPQALQELEPLLEQATLTANARDDTAINNNTTRGTVIVMLCNYGQANLLINFVCAARARGISTNGILVFCTDEATRQLAQSLGLWVYSHDDIFGSVPRQAAHNYSDATFGWAMMAKIYCVHLVLQLGYDVLFQDVDVVWYQSPLEFFHNATRQAATADFDIYFQHDGYHHPERFKPIAANTGLYYVRHNARTLHLLDVFARMGDHVLATQSHQAALTVLVNEHMSTDGLRVKILGDESTELFPNGYALQKGSKITRYMREDNATKPILFHANWLAKNKKRPAFEGTLNWFVKRECFNDATDELHGNLAEDRDVMGSCCLVQPCCASEDGLDA